MASASRISVSSTPESSRWRTVYSMLGDDPRRILESKYSSIGKAIKGSAMGVDNVFVILILLYVSVILTLSLIKIETVLDGLLAKRLDQTTLSRLMRVTLADYAKYSNEIVV